MVISFLEKRIAVRQLFQSNISKCVRRKIILVLFCIPGYSHSETLFESMREANQQGMSGYVFVSEKLSDTTLIALSREASKAGMGMVLNGYVIDGPGGLDATKALVQRINSACCGKNGANWQINPLLYERYKIRTSPSFVIAIGTGKSNNDFSKVSGEMSVSNALKFIAQQSSIKSIRDKARSTYVKAFSTE